MRIKAQKKRHFPAASHYREDNWPSLAASHLGRIMSSRFLEDTIMTIMASANQRPGKPQAQGCHPTVGARRGPTQQGPTVGHADQQILSV